MHAESLISRREVVGVFRGFVAGELEFRPDLTVRYQQVYARFAAQDVDGRPDPVRGIRQCTVGIGGAELARVREIRPNSEVRNNDTHGVLKLTLRPMGCDWGCTFTDAGSAACHGAASLRGARSHRRRAHPSSRGPRR